MLSKNQIKLVHALELKKNRKREGLFVAEGPKVVGDLLRAGYEAVMLFSTRAQEEGLKGLQVDSTSAQQVSEEELRRISFLQHPQEVLAVMRIPVAQEKAAIDKTQLSLALDGVQDPGNLGTIIRIADWFGISTIFCSPDTADVYNPKVVQATMGSLAHVNVVYTELEQLLSATDVPVYGTLLDGQDIYQEALTPHGVIVMGNEGNGISPRIRQLVNRRLLIPNFHPSAETAESLNVAIATAITCSEFRRRF